MGPSSRNRSWYYCCYISNLCSCISRSYVCFFSMDTWHNFNYLGIERIITGIFLPIKGRGATIGLGILVLIFAGLVVAYPGFATWIITVFIGIALLLAGGASIVQGFSGKESGWKRAFLIGVGALLIVIGIMVLVSPVFGAVFAGFVVAIGLLIAGIQMIVAGATGRELHLASDSLHK